MFIIFINCFFQVFQYTFCVYYKYTPVRDNIYMILKNSFWQTYQRINHIPFLIFQYL